jgi:hypothetical protein
MGRCPANGPDLGRPELQIQYHHPSDGVPLVPGRANTFFPMGSLLFSSFTTLPMVHVVS